MAGDVLIVAAMDDLAMHRPAHLGHFLRAFVDQKDHHVDIRVIGGHPGGHLLEQHGLAGARGSDDQSPLPQADGGHQIDDAHRRRPASDFELHALLRVDGGQVFEGFDVEVFLHTCIVDRQYVFGFERRSALTRKWRFFNQNRLAAA
jgi:hypothetical protein